MMKFNKIITNHKSAQLLRYLKIRNYSLRDLSLLFFFVWEVGLDVVIILGQVTHV